MRIFDLNELEGKTIKQIITSPLVYRFIFTDGSDISVGIGGKFSNSYLSWINLEDIECMK